MSNGGRALDFRADINGLRALAVAAVVLYHFGLPGLGGGYVGVDIFFVISGYLMTAIALQKTATGWSGVLDFYLARARRIVPALLAMCVVLLVLGWFFLIPSIYDSLGAQIAASLGFVSNIYFWREGLVYFGADATTRWLLHTWSLSVEWQFYIVYPVLLLVLRRSVGLAYLRAALWILALASFALTVALIGSKASATFYLLPTRAWEMLAGGLVLLHAQGTNTRPASSRLFWTGVVLLLVALVGFERLVWPSALALVPVLGTCLVIAAGRQDAPWLSSDAAQALGRWSYSIYLWHWPVLTAIRYLDWDGRPTVMAGGVLFSVLAGWASFRYVEGPSRRWLTSLGRLPSLGAFAAALGAVIAVGLAFSVQAGLPGRFGPQVLSADAGKLLHNPRRDSCLASGWYRSLPQCEFGSGPKLAAIVWGDSHADAAVTAVAAALEGRGRVLFLGRAACPSRLDGSTSGDCARFNHDVAQVLAHQPADIPLIVINRFTLYDPALSTPTLRARILSLFGGDARGDAIEDYHRGLRETLCQVAKQRPLLVMKQVPEMRGDVPRLLATRALLVGDGGDVRADRREAMERLAPTNEVLERIAGECGFGLIDPYPAMCTGSECLGSRDGVPYYLDRDHLNETGNKLLVPVFRQALESDAADPARRGTPRTDRNTLALRPSPDGANPLGQELR